MNMFKSRRKAKEHFDASEAFESPQSTPMSQRAMKNLKRKNKKITEDSKPTFDLSTALPDDNNFRTSLLMPNLSARFSMLREQDDPNSKLGKASDDSVLFPKRTSRFNLFDQNALADVAEDEPVLPTFRPPFVDRDRSNSLGDGYESDGSIMNRSRPNEGNNLFGGRQKVYRIPNNLSRKTSDNEIVTAGRHVYEPDLSLSQFQLFRAKEKEAQKRTEDCGSSALATDGGESSEIASPATTFSKNRETRSSTNSAPRRTSTAATSIASESPAFRDSATDSVTMKSQEILHAPENISSISVPKTREDPIPNRFASQSRSPTNDKFPRPIPNFSTSLRNATSPPLMPTAQPLDFGFNNESRSTSATGRYRTDSPTFHQASGNDDMLANNLQPNDRGKATALGLFNKPAREFDELQFSQRQLQMHEDQVSTMSNGSRSASQASNDAQRARQGSVPTSSSHPVSDERTSLSQARSPPNASISVTIDGNRASKASERSIALRQRSKSTASSTGASNVRSRVESLIRKNNAELTAIETEKLGSVDNKENFIGTFFEGGDADEETDSDDYCRFDSSRGNSSKIDESDIHPAFRNSYMVPDGQSRKSDYSGISKTKSIFEEDRNEASRLQVPGVDADHLSQQNGVGLSGLIRSHLRRDSDKSSMFRPESGIVPPTTEPSQRGSVDSTNKTTADSLRSDPFDLEHNRGLHTPRISQRALTPTTAMSQVAQQFLSQAKALKNATEHSREEVSVESPVDISTSPKQKSWHEDLEPKHQRGESSETTKERREFDAELAERRKKIREGLKSVTERDRSQSPANPNRSQAMTMQAFVQQRSVTDPQLKATKVLGLQNLIGQNAAADEDRGRNPSSMSESHGPLPQDGFHNTRQVATYARFAPETGSERSQAHQLAAPLTARHGIRERSNSKVAGQPIDRTRPRDVNQAVQPVRGYLGNWSQPLASPTEAPHNHSDPNLSMRTGYRSARTSPPDMGAGVLIQPSAKPSPISPQSPYDSFFDTTRSSPGSHSNGRTTPGTGRSTPSAFSRKRSVTKTMISEPTFVSSTSSVPLVHLPDAQQNPANSTPPLPLMNPRRRGNTFGEKPILSPTGLAISRSTPLEPVPASPIVSDFGSESHGRKTNSPSPRKLRKANSEGGSMAAKAKQQAMAVELAQEKAKSPAFPVFPVFPNRSATALPMTADGAMF